LSVCPREDIAKGRDRQQQISEGYKNCRVSGLLEPGTGADAQQPSLLRRCGSWARLTAGVRVSAGTNRHDVKECKSLTAKVSPTTLAPSHARASVTESVKRGPGNVQAGYGAPKWPIWVPTRSEHAEGHTVDAVLARRRRTRRGRRPLACTETSGAEPGRPCIWPDERSPGPHSEPTGHDCGARGQGVGPLHSVCLAAHVSGGFKSRSVRGHGPISKGGGNASLAEGGGRYGDA
jgi:hypothetical protein